MASIGKINYVGIIGSILAFISLVLPWWTMTLSTLALIPVSIDISIYLYKGTISFMGFTLDLPINVWYGWSTLAFVVLGGVLGILGSIIHDRGKIMLGIGGILILLSILIFAVALQIELSKGMSIPSPTGTDTPLQLPGIILFSSGSLTIMETQINYSNYLSFGLWLALVATIIMFVSFKRARVVTPSPPPPPPPPPPSITCPSCGAQIDARYNICPHCGKAIPKP